MRGGMSIAPKLAGVLALGAVLAIAPGCGDGVAAVSVPGGDASAGPDLITAYGCGTCHTIGGVDATGDIGPDLRDFADRQLIAGKLPNSVPNLIRWLRDPQEVVPGNVMPDLGLDPGEAADLAAYLLSRDNH
jgi:cytochrome c